jgi:sec-independent protein translocase protein TatA
MFFGFINNPLSWVLVVLLIILLFGRGRISDLMGDFAKGIKAFKKGMAEEPAPTAQAETPRIAQPGTVEGKVESREENKA